MTVQGRPIEDPDADPAPRRLGPANTGDNRAEVATPADRPIHGTTAVQAFVTLGAFAALDQLPPRRPNDIERVPRWNGNQQFPRLVDAYAAEQVGDVERVVANLEKAGMRLDKFNPDTDNVGDAIVAQVGPGREVDEGRFEKLFAGTVAEVETYKLLPPRRRPDLDPPHPLLRARKSPQRFRSVSRSHGRSHPVRVGSRGSGIADERGV